MDPLDDTSWDEQIVLYIQDGLPVFSMYRVLSREHDIEIWRAHQLVRGWIKRHADILAFEDLVRHG